MQTNALPKWAQLLVNVGSSINLRAVYLDTSLQRLLYDPSITNVDSNLASKYIVHDCIKVMYIVGMHLQFTCNHPSFHFATSPHSPV